MNTPPSDLLKLVDKMFPENVPHDKSTEHSVFKASALDVAVAEIFAFTVIEGLHDNNEPKMKENIRDVVKAYAQKRVGELEIVGKELAKRLRYLHNNSCEQNFVYFEQDGKPVAMATDLGEAYQESEISTLNLEALSNWDDAMNSNKCNRPHDCNCEACIADRRFDSECDEECR
jgi:hypothetical protein